MSSTFRVWVPGIPQPQGSSRAFVRGNRAVVTSANPALRGWREVVAVGVGLALPPDWVVLDGPVAVTVTFTLPRPKSLPRRRQFPATRPDVDKLARAVLDALTGVVFRDDAQVVMLTAMKQYAVESPSGVQIVVTPMEERALR